MPSQNPFAEGLGAFLGGGTQGFVQGTEYAAKQEQIREQRRREDALVYQQFIEKNRAGFVRLPQQQQESLLRAAFEPHAERGNQPLGPMIETQRQAIMGTPTIAPGVAIQGAQLAANIGDEALMDKFVKMVDPTLGGKIPPEQLDMMEAARIADISSNFEPQSFQNYMLTVQEGRPDFTKLVLRPPDESTSLPEFTNYMAHQALRKIEAKQEPEADELKAYYDKLGVSDPRVNPTTLMNAVIQGMGIGLIMRSAEAGFDLDAHIETMRTMIPKILDIMQDSGVTDPSSQTLGGMIKDRLVTRQALLDPNQKLQIWSRWERELRTSNPKITTDELKAEIKRRTREIIGVRVTTQPPIFNPPGE